MRATRLPLYEEDSTAARSALTSLDDALAVQYNVRRALDHGLARHLVCSVSSCKPQSCCDFAAALAARCACEHLQRTSRVGLCLSARTCLCSSLPMYVPFSKKIGGSNAPMVPCFFLSVVLAQMLAARQLVQLDVARHCYCGRGQRAARHHARGYRGNPRVSGGGTGHVRAYWAVVFLDSNNVATTLREQLKERKATMADTSVAMARLGREFHDCECGPAGGLPATVARRTLSARRSADRGVAQLRCSLLADKQPRRCRTTRRFMRGYSLRFSMHGKRLRASRPSSARTRTRSGWGIFSARSG